MQTTRVKLISMLAISLVGACRGQEHAPAVDPAKPVVGGLSLAAQVGREMFFDPSLSASGKMACATCHDPKHAYGPPGGQAIQMGGPHGDQAGVRAVPSLRYKDYTPAWADLLDNPDGFSAPGPGGGFGWDGRADTLAAQVRLPLLSPFEMANADAADVVRKVEAAAYAGRFHQAFASKPMGDPEAVLGYVGLALQAFQVEDPSFHPYSSKFDLHAGNKIGGTLTPAEARGQKVFSDAKTGNCTSCHFPGAGLAGSSGLFTDFSYEAIGVPRNRAIPANGEDGYRDLGVCGPLRDDHRPDRAAAMARFCGMFKTPTLRNVAQRTAFFHNGVIHSLEQAVRFYNTRDTMPQLWYPTVGGKPKARNDAGFPTYGLVTVQYVGGQVQKFDDLPDAYRGNIDGQVPLDGRAAGTKPPMTERDMSDLICFLNTLTDDYHPPATAPSTGPCVN